jgi:hypothetical protein
MLPKDPRLCALPLPAVCPDRRCDCFSYFYRNEKGYFFYLKKAIEIRNPYYFYED